MKHLADRLFALPADRLCLAICLANRAFLPASAHLSSLPVLPGVLYVRPTDYSLGLPTLVLWFSYFLGGQLLHSCMRRVSVMKVHLTRQGHTGVCGFLFQHLAVLL